MTFREGHIFPDQPGSILKESLLFDKIFLKVKKLLDENGIDQSHEAFVKSIEHDYPWLCCLPYPFGLIVLISVSFEGIICKFEGACDWDKWDDGGPVNMGVGFDTA